MNRKLEQRFRARIRKLVENKINEETPMVPPNDYKNSGVKKPSKPAEIGNILVDLSRRGYVVLTSVKGSSILIKEADAIKVANYIIRVLGRA